MPAGARRWRDVDGVLLLDKPHGFSSNQALQRARRVFSAAKAGHTGTLDPLASGLLPVCFGEATKFSADLFDADKTYEATIRFGVSTDTYDADGTITASRPVLAGEDEVRRALAAFIGEIRQQPPMYSALKRDGQPLYKLARQGIEVERETRQVCIHRLELLDLALPEARIRVRCSKGTYIRSLAHDLGESLGCGAHLAALRRTEVGRLTLEGAHPIEALEAAGEAARMALLLPVDALLQELPRVDLDGFAAQRFQLGNPAACTCPPAVRVRVYGPAGLLGIGVPGAGGVQPKRVVALRNDPQAADLVHD